jgi:hypothetical protein
VSCDETSRAAALAQFPAPFNTWSAGDVFSAILEASRLDVQMGSPSQPKAGAENEGMISLEKGYKFISGWPESLRTHLASRAITGDAVHSELGEIGKFYSTRKTFTPFRRLMVEHVGSYLRELGVPLMKNQLPAHSAADNPRFINEKQAAKKLRVSQHILRKLKVSGRVCKSKSSPSVHIYDNHNLSQVIQEYRGAIRSTKCASVLGVPAYSISVFSRLGLLKRVENKELTLLTDDIMVQNQSLEHLVSRIRSLPVSGQDAATSTLASALTGMLHPELWAKVFSSLLSGDIRIRKHLTHDVLTQSLVIDLSDFRRVMRACDVSEMPDIETSCSQVGIALGMSEIRICGAVHLDLLPGRMVGKTIFVKLADVAEFMKRYVLLCEIRRHYNITSQGFSKQIKALGVRPAGKIFATNYWYRKDLENIYGGLKRGIDSRNTRWDSKCPPLHSI